MLATYPRRLELPSRSFFLFGPRGTGKTTWLGLKLQDAEWFDLLRNRKLLELMRDPDSFRRRVEALKEGSWIVLDEIQRMPELLNEIHAIMNRQPGKYHFALTGSSARRLKRGGVNLLAGRAVNRQFFPLVGDEIGYDFEIDDLLRFGTLPAVVAEGTVDDKIDLLEAYVANYVREEIQQEAAVKNLDSFTQFLEIAGIMNAQVTSVAAIARDAAVARPTVQGYFQVLIDTLIGIWLPAWQPRAKVKEVKHPKFYFFDPGVVRGVAGKLRDAPTGDERRWLLETVVLNELRAWIQFANCGGKLCYWRTPSGGELDFVWVRDRHAVGIEVRVNGHWRPEFSRVLKELREFGSIQKCFGVYCGSERLQDGPVTVLPIKEFMAALSRGEIIP
ncbi:MAG: ATP-binding protein [Candidatus Eisenbacteria sp.]|nr:ATP-binding protein [Candidatus Eisenbacteria bacterium]